jgi:hypothetical protein
VTVEFGTVGFYEAMAETLNDDPVWADKGKDLTYTMVYAYGPPVDAEFLVRFELGRIVMVREAAPGDADAVDAVISGAADVWRGIFEGRINPTVALATGKMKLKGNKTKLLKNMAAFTYVIDTMKRLEFV